MPDPAPGPPTDERDPTGAAPRPARRGRALLAAVAVLAAAAAVLPAVLARTSLRHGVLHRLAPDFRGDVTVGEADLGWLSPVVLRDVRVAAPGAGRATLTVRELATDRPLHALLRAAWAGGGDLGTVTLTGPRLHATVRPGGSDAEDLFTTLLAGGGGGGSPGFTVVVEEGTATLAGPDGAVLAVSDLAATVRAPAGGPGFADADVTGRIGDGERAGDAAATLAGDGAFTLRAQGVPLAAAGPAAVRLGAGDWAAAGLLNADLTGALTAIGGTARGTLRGERVAVRGAGWPAGDRLTLATADLGGGLSWGGEGGLVARQVRFASPPASFTADGPVPAAVPADPAALLDADRRIEGTADLAALAAMLPGTFRLRRGARVEGGTLAFSAGTGGTEDGRTLTAAADVRGLRASVPAVGGGVRPVAPDGPVSVAVRAVRGEDGAVRVERATAAADGLTVAGRGTLDDFAADVRADLAAFDRTFGGLFDLAGSPAGTVDADVRVRRAAADWYTAGVRAAGRSLAFAVPGGSTLREDEATATLAAALVRDAAGAWSVRDVAGKAEAAGDAVSAVPDGDGWSVTLSGDLARWQRRTATVLGELSVRAAGDIRGSAGVTVSRGRWRVDGGTADVARFALDGPGVQVRGDAATFAFAGAGGPDGTLAGRFDADLGPVALRGRDVSFDPAAAVPWTARLVASGDAQTAWRWFPALRDGAAVRPDGRFRGDVRATLSAGEATAAGDFTLTRLDVLTREATPRGPRWRAAWREEEATLTGAAAYRFADDALATDGLALAGAGWRLTAAGRVAGASADPVAELAGTLRTDWPALAPRLGLADAGATVEGVAERPWRLAGPLVPPRGRAVHPALRGELGVGWDRLAAGGFDFGPGDLSAALRDERVTVSGVDWPCAGGRLRTTPELDLAGPEPVVRLPEGRILAGVRLTPETTRGWLGLVSPLAAGAARADGAFSVDLAGAAVPLADALAGTAARASAAGRLRVVRADVTPGPLTDRLLRAARGADALLRGGDGRDLLDVKVSFPTQSVPFRLARGRVYHDGLRAEAGRVSVATAGSVGLDGTLDLRATVPLGGDLGGGDGRAIAVPVGGTLDRPRVDAARLAAGAAEAAVRSEFDRRTGGLRDRLEEKAADELGRLFGRD